VKLVSLLALLGAVSLLAADCGGKGKNVAANQPPAPATTAAVTQTPPPVLGQPGPCTTPSPSLLSRIARNVILDSAQLGHPTEVESAVQGVFVVSAKVSGGGAPKGMVATWAVRGRDGRRLYSLDSNAALISLYGAAQNSDPHLVVSLPGVYRSRLCSGGPGTDHGSNAPPAGGHSGSAG
jgi:hypothetical protein